MGNKAVLVTGGTGFIGRYVVAELLSAGVEVYALTRNASCCLQGVRGVRLVKADITARLILPADVTAVFNCAGVISDEAKMYAVNVTGTKRVVEAAVSRGCHLVHLSSAGVIGPTRLRHVDELTACRPASLYERTKLEAEAIVLEGVDSGLQANMLRPTTVFGVGRDPKKDSFLQLLRSIKSGKYRNIGGGRGLYGIVHAREVARAMLALEKHDAQSGDCFFINNPVVLREFAAAAANVVGCVGPGSIPYPVALAATSLCSALSLVTRRTMPLTWSRLAALTNRTVYSQQRLITSTGYTPMQSVEAYIAQVCREFTSQRLL